MRKQKTLKMTASPSNPNLEGAFEAPSTHNGDISIVFRGSDVSIHGWDGSVWSTIYSRTGDDKQFSFPNTYQNYYVKSLTGSEETVSVSFFSTGRYQGSIPTLAGVNRGVKLYDVDEVPIYTSSDEGKFLTVRTDGSLSWLGINESYVVEVIGTGGEPESLIADVLAHPNTTIVGNPVYENNILTLDGSSYMIHGDIAEFMYQDVMTTNLWFKNTGGSRKSKFWSFGMARTSENKYAHVLQQNTDVDLRFVTAAGATSDPTHSSVDDGQWHMITSVWDNVNGVKRLYLDGTQLGSDITFASKSDPFRDGDDVYGLIIGTGTGAGSVRGHEAYMGQFTKMAIENAVWDQTQISSKFAEGYVTEAPAEGPEVIAGTFLEDIDSVIARDPSKFSNGIYTDNNSARTGGMQVLLKDDGVLEYDLNTNETVNDEFTISWWMNLDSSQAANNLGLAGMNVGSVNDEVRRFAFDLGGGSSLTNPHFISYTRGPRTTNNLSTGIPMAGAWTHVAIVIANDGSNIIASLYLNGSKLNNSISYPLGTKFFPPASHQTFIFGGGYQTKSVKGQFDSMQISDGVALTESQVAMIAAQSDRQMSIETAAAS